MLTLQILDRGQTFLHPLEDRPVTIGSGETVAIRLSEEGVLAEHAVIQPRAGGWELEAKARLLVNGRAAQRAQLALGDRIEIGGAVLVVGRSVARPVQPEEVLASSVRGGHRPRAAGTANPPARRKSRLLAGFGVAGLAVGLLVLVPQWAGDGARVQDEVAALQRLLDQGELERAEASITRLGADWRDAVDGRLQHLERASARLDEVRVLEARLVAEVLDPAIDRSYAQWQRELQQLEHEGDDAQRVAARRVRAALRATLDRRPPAAVARADAPPAPAVAEPKPAPAHDPMAAAIACQQRARQLAAQGLFAQALALLQTELGEAGSAAAVELLQRDAAELRTAAVAAAAELAQRVRDLAGKGQLREALTEVAGVRHRFPEGDDFSVLTRLQRELEGQQVAVEARQQRQQLPVAEQAKAEGEARRQDTIAVLRAQLDRIGTAESAGDFPALATMLREAAELARERDPDFAVRLQTRAAEANLLAAWQQRAASWLTEGKSVVVELSSQQSVTVHGVDGAALLGNAADGAMQLRWSELGANGLQSLVEQVRPQGEAGLGAATMLYQVGNAAAAEALLARLLRSDAALKPAIDPIVARGRGEPLDARGYVLAKDGFVSERSLEIQKFTQRLGSKLESLLRGKDVAARDAFVAEVLQQGPDALAALQAALQRELNLQIQRLEAGPVKKQVAKLAAQRTEIDRLRQHARDLIYDEKTYFYPYKPPAVSGEKHAEYNRVQAEVNRRVDAVRKVWNDDRIRIRVNPAFLDELARLDWTARNLTALGDLDPTRLAAVEWARALPPGESIGLPDYCTSADELQQLLEWRAIEAYNEVAQKALPAGAREQLRITNEYRAMFRHRPLALSAAVVTAAQEHAAEMSRLGYFAHRSPTPGRETPFDRMRLAGYDQGVSENIALHDSAAGAHNAWCHSSGHHRNLLNPRHREFGIGVDGRNWVQNFGSGNSYEREQAFQPDGGRSRPYRR